MATFTRDITVPLRNERGDIQLDDAAQPLVSYSLGTFTFREPNLRERTRINIQIDHDVAAAGGLEQMRSITFRQIVALAHFPLLMEKAPNGFEIAQLRDEEMEVLLDGFQRGLEEVSPKNSVRSV